MSRIPSLLPEDPALATVIQDAMAETFGDAFTAAQDKTHAEAQSRGDVTQEMAEQIYEEMMSK